MAEPVQLGFCFERKQRRVRRGEKASLNEIIADPDWRSNLEARFWPKVDKKGPNECWPWTAKAKHPFGYGRMTAGRKNFLKAHRIAYALAKGAIPNDLRVLHSCDNPQCCNPNHLRLGTAKDNTRDAIMRGRFLNPPVLSGEEHPNARLRDDQVDAIRRDPRTIRVLAKIYDTSEQTIWRIKNYRTRV